MSSVDSVADREIRRERGLPASDMVGLILAAFIYFWAKDPKLALMVFGLQFVLSRFIK